MPFVYFICVYVEVDETERGVELRIEQCFIMALLGTCVYVSLHSYGSFSDSGSSFTLSKICRM